MKKPKFFDACNHDWPVAQFPEKSQQRSGD